MAGLGLLLGLFACTVGGRIGSGSVAQQDWDKRRGPVVPHDSFPKDCSLCHEGQGWSSIRSDFRFDHERETGVALAGMHARAECLRCHNDRGPVELFSQRGCVGCHEDAHRGKQGNECSTCHAESSWRVNDAIAAHNRTRFPLIGSHAGVECYACHAGAQVGNFDRTSTECSTCHQTDLAQAASPDHVAQGWTSNCQQCHAPTTWTGDGFNHATFPLLGEHRQIACNACHVGDVFAGTPTQCVDCHSDDYAATVDPPHAASGIPTSCQSCHNATAWTPATFDHGMFPLEGAHAQQSCSECHVGGVYGGTPNTCVGCHQDDFDGTTNPPHASAGYPTTCNNCHNVASWSPATFDHTDFPLTGAHAQQVCNACHAGGVYQGTPDTCAGCHLDDYQGADDPDHVAGNFPQACQTCHSDVAWSPASFDHASFPLTGAHAQQDCNACHSGGVYEGLPSACVDCHQGDYDATSDPDHETAGFPVTCRTCHTDVAWTPATFDHESFPLTGAHVPLACASCHGGGVYEGTPNTCVGCHQGDYNTTSDPPHRSTGIPTGCVNCHNTVSWDDATFNHQGVTGSCQQCHMAEYNATSSPDHEDDGYPFACATCHTSTSTWDSVSWNHTWFPITSGDHHVDCDRCHTTPQVFTAFSCITGCHSQSSTNNDHDSDEVPDYQYNSNACYQCHPTGHELTSGFGNQPRTRRPQPVGPPPTRPKRITPTPQRPQPPPAPQRPADGPKPQRPPP